MKKLTMLGWSLLLASQMTMAQMTAPAPSITTTTTSATATRPSDKLVAEYSSWAGSTENSQSLVNGLRTGRDITLTNTAADSSTTTMSFSPTTKPMGYGNVKIALSLAKTQLASQGITNPTTEQLKGALVGAGEQQGILQMRASGMGWGQIANAMGVKLGGVVSGKMPVNTTTATTEGGGITTEARTRSASSITTGMGQGNATDRSSIVTASGGKAGSGGNAYGKGITTANGVVSSGGGAIGMGQGNAYGRGGVVSAGGGKVGGGGNAYGKGGKP